MATAEQARTEQEWRCEEPGCGRTFSRKQGLGRHMAETHGAQTTRERKGKKTQSAPSKPPASPMVVQVQEHLREITAPLREQVREIDERLAVVTAEVTDLREAKRQIEAVISRLEPQEPNARPGVAAATQERAERQRAEKAERIRVFLSEHAAEFGDGFTTQQLIDKLQADAGGGISHEMARKIMGQLHDEGFVRADRVVRGGGMQYKLITNGEVRSG